MGRGASRPRRQHGLYAFHESRDTKHESRLFWPLCFSRITVLVPSHDFPAFPTISRHFPGTPPPQIKACISHHVTRRSACGSRITRHETRPLRFTGRQTFLSGANQPPRQWFSRDTNHVFLVPLGTEALQSFFFRPGLLSMSTGRTESWPERLTKWRGDVRERAAGSRREPPATATRPLCFSRNTRHETRITAFLLFTNHGFYGFWVLKPFSLFFPPRPA